MANPKCVNPSCSNHELQRVDGVYAFTKVTKEAEGIAFHPASGVPVVCYVCSKCGEVSTYSAKFLNEI